MDRLHTKAADCEYHEYDQTLTKQFINGLADSIMIGKILSKLSVLKVYMGPPTIKIINMGTKGGDAESIKRSAGPYEGI